MLLQFQDGRSDSQRQAFDLGPALTDRITGWLQTLLDGWELPVDTVMEITLVAEEMTTNVQKYAGLKAEDSVEIIAQIQDSVLTLETHDGGRAFDPLRESHRSTLGADIESAEIGGLGVHLVTQLTDRQSYKREGAINIFRVEKDLAGQ